MGLPQSANPVSYTHLDVYKRQLHKVAMIVSPITVTGEEIYHVTMTDKYDFTFEGDYSSQAPSFWQRAMKAGAIGGNNLAWLDSKLGVINEYNIVIDFYY